MGDNEGQLQTNIVDHVDTQLRAMVVDTIIVNRKKISQSIRCGQTRRLCLSKVK